MIHTLYSGSHKYSGKNFILVMEDEGGEGRGKKLDSRTIKDLRDVGFNWTVIAEMMNVSTKTLQRWRERTGFDEQNAPIGKFKYMEYFEVTLISICTKIGDEELESTIRNFMEENVRRGQKMTEGHLLSLGLSASRKRIRDCMKSLDPDGVQIRKTKRLKRRVYSVPGCHYLWHMDGCHKLIKYRFVVHAAIDGYSRYIPFIKCSNNNKASTVLKEFKKGCKDLKVLPRRLRTDKGGENRHVCRFLLETFGADSGCCITGKSTGNQRGERLFRDSTEQALSPYITLFQDFVVLGLNVDNIIQMFVLHHLFLDRINESLSEFRDAWNNHKVRTEHNRTPVQILIMASVNNNNHGVVVKDEVMAILDDVDIEENEYYANQVVCDSPYCPFNVQQLSLFRERVFRISREETFTSQNLFQRFIHGVAMANEILSV